MGIYLGLGSNLGDRRSNLSRAITQLETKELRVTRVSPVIESAAQLPENCPAEWDRPFLNLAVECETEALRLMEFQLMQTALGVISMM